MKEVRMRTTASRRRRHVGRNLVLSVLLICLTFRISAFAEMQAHWTPNPEDDGGPLPLSQEQRQQLLKLEQAIVKSPDPQATLTQAAAANEMDPHELANLLERNRRDLEAAGVVSTGGAARGTVNAWPQKVIKMLGSIGVLMSQAYRRNPKMFSLLTSIAMLLMYIMATAPRTGLVISSARNAVSKGHTTMWRPPQKYIAGFIESPRFEHKTVSLPSKTKGILQTDDLPRYLESDGKEIHKLNRKSKLSQALTVQRTIYATKFLSEGDGESTDVEEETNRRADIAETIFEAATNVLLSRRLTEFVDGKSVALHSSTDERKRFGMLVVHRLGDWGRFGLQPLKVSHQHEDETIVALAYSTLKGGHFDGQIHWYISQRQEDAVCIQVRIIVPKKGKKLSKKILLLIGSALAESIEKSVMTETKQTLARQTQGRRYRGSVHNRASERRRLRFENEKKHEEMAENRRRKWQSRNPDAGRYRPSGERMRSPNFVT